VCRIFTSVAGRPLDDPAFEPIFATMAEFDLPIWLHPHAPPTCRITRRSKSPGSRCGGASAGPYDTSVAMVRMVFAGLLDRYPGPKIITHHLGGMIPYYDGRIGPGLQVLGSRTSDEDYSNILPSLKRPHLDYLHEFYGDTAPVRRWNPGGALRARVLRQRPCRVRDRHAARPIAPTIDTIKRLDIADEDRRKIFVGNAERLLKMKLS
jgi:aminocarboxymuconate-semialdehyde decarboxylase